MIHFYYHFSVIAVIASCCTCRLLVLGVFNIPELYVLIVYLFYCSMRLNKVLIFLVYQEAVCLSVCFSDYAYLSIRVL